jgi:hypothetical protein
LSVDYEVFDDRKRFGSERLNHDVIAVVELPHVELASRRSGFVTVRLSVDHATARPADPFSAIRLECNGLFARSFQAFIDDIKHLQKGHVFEYVCRLVGFEVTLVVGSVLPPNVQFEVHL